MRPAVPAAIPSVGIQWRPLASCSGNSQISFWSWKKSRGSARQLSSRSEVWSCACSTDWIAGDRLSGRFASFCCAWIRVGKAAVATMTKLRAQGLNNLFTESLDAGGWSRGRIQWTPRDLHRHSMCSGYTSGAAAHDQLHIRAIFSSNPATGPVPSTTSGRSSTCGEAPAV